MGVRCTALGHVYETTEFEEHRKERPEGVVLICREYHVCSRCGSREELYRNERLLTPRDAGAGDGDGSGEQRDRTADSAPDDADLSGTSEDTTRGRTAGETARPDAGDGRGPSAPADAAQAADPSDSTWDADLVNADRDVDLVDSRRDVDSVPPDANAGPERATDEGGTGSGDGERSQDSENSENSRDDENSEHSGARPGADANDRGRTSTEGDGDDPIDDAVIISETVDSDAASSDSERNAASEDRETLGCRACGRTWAGETTSLRDGDLCPECRRGYVEAS